MELTPSFPSRVQKGNQSHNQTKTNSTPTKTKTNIFTLKVKEYITQNIKGMSQLGWNSPQAVKGKKIVN